MTTRHIRCPMCGRYNTGFEYIAPTNPNGVRTVTEIHYCNDCNAQFKVDYDLSKCPPISVYRIVK